ncbi:MAG: hypothetical protein K1Y02_07265 [Candidatus Hydrogenedentes bacterium]|nr:hypothetical protein [Candidatus Hydrogenedentota bacterium]
MHSWLRAFALCILLGIPSIPAYSNPEFSQLAAHADDYVFGFYPYGWRNRDPQGDIVFAVQGMRYALLLNASRACIEKAGNIDSTLPAQQAAHQGNHAILDPLPATPVRFEVRIDGKIYQVAAGAPRPESVLIQRMGKFVVNVEVRDITLRSADGKDLENTRADLIAFCWPDHARLTFRLSAESSLADVAVAARYAPGTAGMPLTAVNLLPEAQSMREEGAETFLESSLVSLNPGETATVSLALLSRDSQLPDADSLRVRATGIAPYTQDLLVTYDPAAGWFQVMLGENADIWTTERIQLSAENPTEKTLPLPLAFSKRRGGFGITGMSPVLCDESGAPIGLPVQISKNWHCKPPWFDGVTVLNMGSRAQYALQFRLAYATWGGTFAVSHAQLALEGWGTHQLWDECAIGSFGESITYDPDINLNRSMVDDIRPLMVWGMGKEPQRKWSWTHNVGGADFLVLEQDGKRQILGRQKTEYEAVGPVLTTVRYSGETPGGALQSHVTTQSWSSDDCVRALYTLRYDVSAPVSFSRLAFFQLGADNYNTNLFKEISRGNLNGVQETWTPPMGGKQYSRRHEPLIGDVPWLAITGNEKNPPPFIAEGDQGAWADRGMIVRRWSARLGGVDVPLPHYAVFGTEDGGVPSAILELSPPPGLTTLNAGDFVDAQVEMVILPQRAEDYYGPNAAFAAALREYGGDWRLVHREAKGGTLKVTAEAATVVSTRPVVLRATHGAKGVFSIEGGCGPLAITITNLKRYTPFSLHRRHEGETIPVLSSSDLGCWQSRYHPSNGTYDITFILPLDLPGGISEMQTFVWSCDAS